MIVVKTTKDLDKILAGHIIPRKTVGFVPTMGALHQGHIALILHSVKLHPVTVSSIFINPAQFNNLSDFEKYPVTLEKDIDLLEEAGCNILFMPSVAEMYPANEPVKTYKLGYLETILEGKFRPGHYQGVCRIVDKLVAAVKPTELFLGQKDYQQCMVIKKMLGLCGYTTQLRVCNTVRESEGLAMSSRNMRLLEKEKTNAVNIIKTLQFIQSTIAPGSLKELKAAAANNLTAKGFKVDYVEIAHPEDLLTADTWDGRQPLIILAAAFINDIRLIDNLLLDDTALEKNDNAVLNDCKIIRTATR